MPIYKGFDIKLRKDVWGYYDATITKYKNKGTRRQEYILEIIDTYEQSRQKALKMVKEKINEMKDTEWRSSGLGRADYLPP